MLRRFKTGPQKEDGAIMILFALVFVILLGFVALAVDFGGGYAARLKLQDTAQVSLDSVRNYDLVIFNADGSREDEKNAGEVAAEAFLESSRANGHFDECEFTFYELTSDEVSRAGGDPTTQRVVYYQGKLTEYYKTSFAKILGFKTLPIEVEICAYMTTNSDSNVWRCGSISDIGNGVYRCSGTNVEICDTVGSVEQFPGYQKFNFVNTSSAVG